MENPSPPQTPKSEMTEDSETHSLANFHCLNTNCAQKQYNDSRTIKDLKFLIDNREKELQREKNATEELRSVNSTVEKDSRKFQEEADAKQALANDLSNHISEVVAAFEQLKVHFDKSRAEYQALKEESADKLQQIITMNGKESDDLKKGVTAQKERGDKYKEQGLKDKTARKKAEQTVELLQAEVDNLKKRGPGCADTAIVEIKTKAAQQIDELTRALNKERALSQQRSNEAAQFKAAGEKLLKDVEHSYFKFSDGASADIVKIRRFLSVVQDEEARLAGHMKQAVETYKDTANQVDQQLNSTNGRNDDQSPNDTREPRTSHSATISPSPSVSQPVIKAPTAPRSMRSKNVTFEDVVRDHPRYAASPLVCKRTKPPAMDGDGSPDEPLTKRVRRDKNYELVY